MKKIVLLGTLITVLHVNAQEIYRDLLSTDPELANGYFIIDSMKADSRGVARVEVDINAARADSDSTFVIRNLQKISITNGHYGALDPQVLIGTDEDDRVYYTLTGFDLTNNVVYGPVSNIGEPWPDACHIICHSTNYAWRLNGFGNGNIAAMDITNAAQDGSPIYFYIPYNNWGTWSTSSANHPSNYGFGSGDTWPGLLANENQTEVVYVDGAPPLALAQNGYYLGSSGPAYAIRKDRGPWRHLSAYTNPIDQHAMCLNMVERYNIDALVLNALNTLNPNPGPLQCWALPTGGGGLTSEEGGSGGSGPFNPCTQVSLWESAYNGNVLGWANAVIDCFTTYTPTGGLPLSGIHRIDINRWEPGSSTPIVGVDIPDERDPKLIPFPRTILQPGLYEFRMLMKNGNMIRHFEAIDYAEKVSADFASFVNINIYPVPVTDRHFSVDMELLVPMDIGLTIINSYGATYYTKNLEFDVSGKNKHVVEMNSLWPEGIYHAVFQFADGSSNSVTFNVAR